jgi:hypothetical protein
MASTVRVDDDVHATLVELASAEHRPIGRVIEDAIGQYRKKKFWKEVRESYERLHADPIAWQDYQDEARMLQGGSMDGLKDEEPYYSPEEVAEIEEHAKSQGW